MTVNDIIAYSFLALWFLFSCGVLLWARIEDRKTSRKVKALFEDFIYTQELIRYNLEWKEMILKHKRKKLIKDLEQKVNEVRERSENEHRTDN